jgi:ketosteroid isomerase-like protein
MGVVHADRLALCGYDLMLFARNQDQFDAAGEAPHRGEFVWYEPVLAYPIKEKRGRRRDQMTITPDRVREIFKGLENGDGAAFFQHVADDVDWTVMGTHPLAGQYLSKQAFIEGTFAKLAKVLPRGAQLHVEHLIVKDNQAVVELYSLAKARNGMRFDNRYCWVVYFHHGVIVRVRAYLDSAMVARLFEENAITSYGGASL